ncbi:dipeptide/oligopeptide/nickel ABC transporter permease/ATP-binding protein [Pseudofrankia sp. BMG5.36]|uniref:dipeptide/oligopeptide/nickel ABC transporter permease/ATP-binding protein n=1 Tax=Pseudofrankia sp. BMG5.36 TaxID=1834512 RepID=UPI0009F23AE7|nr:dipeptide/oligopeptide/nickel ABC transporter permease/ATP-binding protein [Pseudofrankia sp. BMG5.36]
MRDLTAPRAGDDVASVSEALIGEVPVGEVPVDEGQATAAFVQPGQGADEEASPASAGTWRRLARQRGAVVAAGWLLLLVLAATLAPWVTLHAPAAQDLLHSFGGPSASHWLGTDDLGRDVFSRLVYGARSSLQVSFESVALALVLAIPVGLFAGYRGGQVDNIVMRFVDGGMSVPPLVLALAVVAALGPGANNASLALAIVFMPAFTRLIRGQTLAVKEETFVEASRSLGTPPVLIVARRVFPNVVSTIIVQASLTLGGALLAEAALSFVGLGAQPPSPSWGSMLQQAYSTGLFTHAWSLVVPGAAIAAGVLAFNTLGDGLAAALGVGRPSNGRRRRWGKSRLSRGLTRVDRGPVTAPPAPRSPDGDTSRDTLLSVEGLRVVLDTSAGPVPAVEDVSLRIGEGEIVALVGESGSGKSLTSMAIMRLLASPPAAVAAGQVTFAGQDLLSMDLGELRRIRGRDIGMVFQDPMSSLNPSIRVGEQIAEAVRLHERVARRTARERAVQMLVEVGIADPAARMRCYPHELSGGMRQRVMIAMALVCGPRLLIADEPTTGLDVTVQAQILELLRRLRRERMAVLFVTHDLGVVADLCDRVAVMYAGQIVEEAPIDDLFARPRHPYTEGLLRASRSAQDAIGESAAITGSVPALGRRPAGCHFHPRCQYAIDLCRTVDPPLVRESGRYERCHRAAELTLRGVA